MSKFEKRVAVYYGYEGFNNNPNGDPANENKPRQYNGKEILTTDVSSKRDDRDYLIKLNDNSVFLKQKQKEDGTVMQMDDMIKNILKDKKLSHNEKVSYLLNRFIDIKFYGAAFTGKEKEDEESLKESVTGPVQKTFGISLNYPNSLPIKITTILATKADNVGTGSMGTKYICDYYYIHYDVIVNPKSLEIWGVEFTEDDFKVFERTQWCSIKNDITHSKIDREPLVMIEIFFKDDDFYFLPMKYVKSKKQKDVKESSDLGLDFSGLVSKITSEKANIEKIKYKTNSAVDAAFKTGFLDKINCTKEEIQFITTEDLKKILKSYEEFKM